MATRKEKVTEMSEIKANGEGETTEDNGWLAFTLSAVHPDFDIVCRIREDGLEGVDVGSLVKLANKGYGHVQSNERKAAGGSRDEEKFPDRDAFERTWALKKRQAIIDGEYTVRSTGPRGPRLSDFDLELRNLIDTVLILPRLMGNPIPKSGKTEMGGQTLDWWRDYCKNKPEYAYLHEQARENVAKAKAAAEEMKAQATGVANAFATL